MSHCHTNSFCLKNSRGQGWTNSSEWWVTAEEPKLRGSSLSSLWFWGFKGKESITGGVTSPLSELRILLLNRWVVVTGQVCKCLLHTCTYFKCFLMLAGVKMIRDTIHPKASSSQGRKLSDGCWHPSWKVFSNQQWGITRQTLARNLETKCCREVQPQDIDGCRGKRQSQRQMDQ